MMLATCEPVIQWNIASYIILRLLLQEKVAYSKLHQRETTIEGAHNNKKYSVMSRKELANRKMLYRWMGLLFNIETCYKRNGSKSLFC